MLRLPLLVAAALILPAAGRKPAQVISPANVSPSVSASWAPKIHFPRLPHFSRRNTTQRSIAQMNTRLRNLVVEQEAWYVQNKSYSKDVNKLSNMAAGDSAARSNVQVQIVYATRSAWTAIATHPNAPSKSCVVYVGVREKLPLVPRSWAEGNEANMEGIPACDAK